MRFGRIFILAALGVRDEPCSSLANPGFVLLTLPA